MAYQSWSVVFGEQPSAAKWNILGTNDASFNDGTGIANLATNTTAISNPYKFSVYRNAAWTTSDGTPAKVVFDAETFDTNNNFATGTYTVPVAGFYQFNAGIQATTNGYAFAAIYKNGAAHKRGVQESTAAGIVFTSIVSALVQCAASDTIEIYFQATGANAGNVGADLTYFSGFLASRT